MISANGSKEAVAVSCVTNNGACHVIPHWRNLDYYQKIKIVHKPKKRKMEVH